MAKSAALKHFERGLVHEQAGALAKAKEEYKLAISANDDDVTGVAAYNLGNVLSESGDQAGAADAWYRAVQAPPSAATASAAFNLGNLLADRDAKSADMLYEMAMHGSSELRSEALINRGNMRAAHGDTTGAMADYNQVISNESAQYAQAAKTQAAALHVAQNRTSEAIKLLSEAAAGPAPRESAIAYFNLGNVLSGVGNSHGAHAAYVTAMDSGVQDPAARAAINLGNMLRDAGDEVGASAAYARAVAFGDPDLASWALNEKGAGLLAAGNYEGAEAAFRQACSVGGLSAEKAALNLGITLKEQGRISDARGQWEKLVDVEDPQVGQAARRLLSTYRG